jgi:hypothetical protein
MAMGLGRRGPVFREFTARAAQQVADALRWRQRRLQRGATLSRSARSGALFALSFSHCRSRGRRGATPASSSCQAAADVGLRPADRVVEVPALSAVLGHVLRGHAARAGLTVDERHQVTLRVLEYRDR